MKKKFSAKMLKFSNKFIGNLLKWLPLLLRCACWHAEDLSLVPKMFRSPTLDCDSTKTVSLLNRRYPHCMGWHYSLKAPLDFEKNGKYFVSININSNWYPIFISVNSLLLTSLQTLDSRMPFPTDSFRTNSICTFSNKLYTEIRLLQWQ